MARLKSDFVVVCEHGVQGSLDEVELEWDRRTALGVVMAARGYPDAPVFGDVISGLPTDSEDATIFHAGTTLQDGTLVTSGGRVLCVTALGDSVRMAQKRAYEVVEQIHYEGAQYRRDIGWRALNRKH
jgi:phosphoribosylamine--glycine ligase